MRIKYLPTLLLLLLVLVLMLRSFQNASSTLTFFPSLPAITFWVFIICSYGRQLASLVRRKHFLLRSVPIVLLAGVWMAVEGELSKVLPNQSTVELLAARNQFLGRGLFSDTAQWIEFVRATHFSVVSSAGRLASTLWPSMERLVPATLIALLVLALRPAAKKCFLRFIPNAYLVFVAQGSSESAGKFGRYIRLETLQALMTALLWGGALWLLSIPNGFSLAVVMAMASLIPYWGICLIGFAPVVMTAVFNGNAFQAAALSIALSAIWLLRKALLGERLHAARPRIPAVAGLALLLSGAIIGGSGGLLLILPMSSVVLIFLRTFWQARSMIVRKANRDPLTDLSP